MSDAAFSMSQCPTPRPEVAGLMGDSHGGPDHAELSRLGLKPADVLDFSASTNAFGPPPGVAAALAGCDVSRYPDRGAAPLRQALAQREGVRPDEIVCGSGAAQLIWAIALAYVRPGDACLVAGPTFGEYRVASQLLGGRVVEVRATAGRQYRPDVAELAEAVSREAPRLVWLCNPNNPTGAYLDETDVTALLAAAPGALWVIDEAYRPFVARPWPSERLIERGDVVLLRSLTKDCALPGVRLGYALGPAPVVEALRRALPPWSAGAPAIAAGLAALAGGEHVRRTIAVLRDEAVTLRAALAASGWTVLPSATHFFLVQVGDAAAVRARLLARNLIQVRDCASFGLPEFIRVAARLPEENARLWRALEALR